MKKSAFSLLCLTLLMAAACGRQQGQMPAGDDMPTEDSTAQANDSTVYGLACDGCTDTIVVFLPLSNISSDPDTFNILSATRRHRVFGHPKVGDRLALVRNANDTTVADFVIDMDDLMGSWCYTVVPTLRQRADQSHMTQKQLAALLPDSLRETLLVPHEYGFQLKGDQNARPIGQMRPHTTADEEAPVIYPERPNYREWRLHNGRLILTELGIDSLGNSYATHSDTADFVLMMRDSLALRFPDGHVQGYYRKQTEE